ncbi:hypothetical protein DL765_011323 [Monosporascus sp. GIB2]|nr:hypothetical protein DL765_011323 [Monosporascus sp. GIB2]
MSTSSSAGNTQPRMRIRELLPNIVFGDWKPGPLNSITDVAGVRVHTQEIFADDGNVDTGVTCILPREDCHWINETGLLHSPVVITNTFAVGAAYQGIYEYTIKPQGFKKGETDWYPEHVIKGLESVSSERVREGAVGGGTGIICHYFKGGTGSSSRLVPGFDAKGEPKTYTIAALVQANYGKKPHLRIQGVPVGRILAEEAAEAAENDAAQKAAQEELEVEKNRKDGSIIVILATDAPLHPTQLQRIAKRATVSLARVGGNGHNGSGDIFLAFSTGNGIPAQTISMDRPAVDPFRPTTIIAQLVDDSSINGLFEAAADATEEAIYNALCMAETMTGNKGHKVEALPLERVKEIMSKYL